MYRFSNIFEDGQDITDVKQRFFCDFHVAVL
jgi:hypothetical protein